MLHVRDRIASAVIFAVAAAAWWVVYDVPAGARLFPALISGAMAAVAAVMFVRSFVTARAAVKVERMLLNGRNLLVACVVIVAYVALMPVLGYFTATALLVFAFAVALGFRRPAMLVVTTALFLALVYGVFVVVFDRQLPPEFFSA